MAVNTHGIGLFSFRTDSNPDTCETGGFGGVGGEGKEEGRSIGLDNIIPIHKKTPAASGHRLRDRGKQQTNACGAG